MSTTQLIAANALSILSASYAFVLALRGREGWIWFLVVALILWGVPS